MNKLRAINAAPRHRLVLDLRIPVFWTGEFFSAAAGPARREIGPVVFNSRLMQPLFTSFPEFYAKTRYAPASRHGPANHYLQTVEAGVPATPKLGEGGSPAFSWGSQPARLPLQQRHSKKIVTKSFKRFYLLLQSAHENKFDFILRVFERANNSEGNKQCSG